MNKINDVAYILPIIIVAVTSAAVSYLFGKKNGYDEGSTNMIAEYNQQVRKKRTYEKELGIRDAKLQSASDVLPESQEMRA